MNLDKLEKRLKYKFQNRELLQEALIHPSACKSRKLPEGKIPFNYERLEFLGDSVVGLIISEYLFLKFTKVQEGPLAIKRSELISGKSLAKISRKLKLSEECITSENQKKIDAQKSRKNRADLFEAVLGAIFIDGGYYAARDVAIPLFEKECDVSEEYEKDPKSALQEYIVKHNLPRQKYQLVEKTGKDHEPKFKVKVTVGKTHKTLGKASTIKKAEHIAARLMLKKLKKI